jgi:hypothetical protein
MEVTIKMNQPRIRHLRLIKSDFRDYVSLLDQWSKPDTCPIATAFKRVRPDDNIEVGASGIYLNGHQRIGSFIEDNGDFDHIINCKESLDNGAKYAIVRYILDGEYI